MGGWCLFCKQASQHKWLIEGFPNNQGSLNACKGMKVYKCQLRRARGEFIATDTRSGTENSKGIQGEYLAREPFCP